MRKLLVRLLWDAGLPAVVYYGAHGLGYDVQTALTAAGVAALLRVVFVALLHRRLEVVAAIIGGTFAVLLAISLLTDDPRILLAKESVLSGAAGIALVGSCLIGKPLIYLLTPAPRRRHLTTITWLFGVVLLLDAIVRLVLIYSLPLDTMANLSPILHIGVLALLAACALWFRSRRRLTHSDMGI